MTVELMLIFLSLTVILAYLLDIISSRTKIPPVIWMLLAGMLLRLAADQSSFHLPHINTMLPLLGTIGLILIVLDAGLDLDIALEKLPLIRTGFGVAFAGMLLVSAFLAAFFHVFLGADVRTSLINAIPFSVISSALAIPGARHLADPQREFVTYESSFSDILGILFFNVILLNDTYGPGTLFSFFLELLSTSLVSIVFALALLLLIAKIRHKIKFLPIFSVLLLAYATAKKFHLSPLILVLIFGLMLNNFHLIIRGNLRSYFDMENLHGEVNAFNSVISELTFVVKVFFFLLLGYSVNIHSLLDYRLVLFMVLPILMIIYMFRYPALYALNRDGARGLRYYAPRGLITILLFQSVPRDLRILKIGDGVMLWLILATSTVMTLSGILRGPGRPAAAARTEEGTAEAGEGAAPVTERAGGGE